jgi:hypothetical protein
MWSATLFWVLFVTIDGRALYINEIQMESYLISIY